MRTSGRGSSEVFMFLAPAAIFGGFFLWLYGDPQALVMSADRAIVRTGYAVLGWLAALVA